MAIRCESEITQVVVHGRGALVRRKVVLPAELPDGEVDLVVEGVTPLAEAGSVRASLDGGGRTLVSLTSGLHVPEGPAAAGRSVERVQEIVARIGRLRAEQGRLAARRDALLQLRLEPALRPLSLASGATGATRIAEALACAALVKDLVAGIDERILTLVESLRELELARKAAVLADAQTSSVERMGSGHPTRRIELRLGGSGPVVALALAYVVPAARWWPIYTLRLGDGGARAEWLLEALVAQRSGESWSGVELDVSTADLLHDARLPELPSLRLGRAQPPARRDYRPAPPDLAKLFAGYDRSFPSGTTAPAPAVPIVREDDNEARTLDELPSDDLLGGQGEGGEPLRSARGGTEESFAGVMPAMAAPPAAGKGSLRLRAHAPAPPSAVPMRPPAPQRAQSMSLSARDGMVLGRATLESALPPPAASPPPEPAFEPADAFLDFDRLTLATADDHARRGRLVHAGTGIADTLRRSSHLLVDALAPAGLRDPIESRGMFDHRYRGSGRADVPSDGQLHRVALGAAETGAVVHFVSAPREAPEVYRAVALTNPFGAPLLAGPVDVYLDGQLLVTAAIERVDKGGAMQVGLGVEERVRVARNAHVEEEATGLLGGSLAVHHAVTIDLSSSLARPIVVEVLERVPVTDDKTVKIDRVATRPEAEPYSQAERGRAVRGGLLWKVSIPPAGKVRVELAYRVILPSKSEVEGGNRRE